MKNIQLNLFGEKEMNEPFLSKPKIVRDKDYYTLEMFLFYPKTNKNKYGNPLPKQSVRSRIVPLKNARPFFNNGKKYYQISDFYVSHYQTKDITDTEEALLAQAVSIMKANHFPTFKEEVIIEEITYYFKPLKSFTKKVKEDISKGIEIPKTTTPDLSDNLNKLLLDALNKVVYKDDSIIWSLNNVKKIYGITPGVKIRLAGK